MVVSVPEVKSDFFPRCVVKFNKYAYSSEVLPMICLCNIKFI